MPQYLYASSKTLLKINNTDTEDTTDDTNVLKEVISVQDVKGPLTKLNPTATGGVLNKTEYLDVYSRVSGFVEREWRLPTLLSTSLGDVHCNSFLYLSGQLLNSYKKNSVLPDFVHRETWHTLSEHAHSFYTQEQVESAAQWTENYIETYHKLPDQVEIAGKKINTYTYLKMASVTLLNIHNNFNASILTKPYTASKEAFVNNVKGSLDHTEYMELAFNVQRFMFTTKDNKDWVNYIKQKTNSTVEYTNGKSGMVRTQGQQNQINTITIEVERDKGSTQQWAEKEFKILLAATQYHHHTLQ